MTKQQIDNIENTIIISIENKLQKYKPESINMPFHFRLLGKDRIALYSFIQSLNTTFGTSIFEPVAVQVAKPNFKIVKNQFALGQEIFDNTQKEIQTIINKLSAGEIKPCMQNEISAIQQSLKGVKIKTRTVKADIYLQNENNTIYLFDIKTAKPNISSFKDHKRTLLEWAGILLTKNNKLIVNTAVAIPYNPYEPKPYERWTLKGMLENNSQLKVASEFWDFLGGKGTYNQLLDCFESAGLKLKNKIDKYFKKFK
jgi:type II restriction enzyme